MNTYGETMIVLHAGLVDHALLLWAEPLAASLEEAADALAPLARYSTRIEAYVWVPVAGERPLASNPMLEATADVGENPATALACRPVGCLRLAWNDAIGFLCTCMERKVIAPGVLIGSDLRFWANALRFVGLLVHRKAYLPGLVHRGGRFLAVWEPVIDGEDGKILAGLAAAMPPSARALAMEPEAEPSAPGPEEVLGGFFTEALDSLVRSTTRQAAGPSRGAQSARGPKGFDSLHDQWLHALNAAEPALDAEPAELERLKAQIDAWRRPLTLSVRSAYRLIFRLEEPPEAGANETPGRWFVRYLVQPVADESLLIPVADALRAKGGGSIREFVLSALGRASVLSPEIDRSLKSSAPAGYHLDETGAYRFLSSDSPSLAQSGFGVLLPSWWTRKGAKVRLSVGARVKSSTLKAGAGMTLDKVLGVRWEVALGDQVLSREELEALAEMKAPLVRVRGQWVAMNAEEIRAALAFWKGRGETRMKARDIISLSLGTESTVAGMGFRGVQADGWIGELLERLGGDSHFEELPPPNGFRGTLRPYQIRGYSWLSFLSEWGLGACLADDMGLGKTVQALAFIQARRSQGERRPFLLVCPTSVVANWKKEAARFTPECAVSIHHGVGRKKGQSLKAEAEAHAIVISTYSLAHRDLEHLAAVSWAGVILDEAQNIKNPEAKQARAVRSLSADCRFALTGTPVENHVGDLWSIMEFLNPGLLGSREQFKRRFFIPIQANRDPEAAAGLKRLTAPFILRRLKTDPRVISDLPKKTEMKVWCTLTREQASLYKAVVNDAEEKLEAADGIQRRGVILATLTKLKQVLDHPAHFLKDNSRIEGRSGKLQRLTEMLAEVLENDERALIFSQFAEMGEILRVHLEATFGEEAPFLHGGVPRARRDAMVERFQSDARAPHFFILSLKAGGTGLNLTRANHVFHYDRWWNPAVENQATDRVFRIGQKKNVEVHAMLCSGTVEEHIDELIEKKKQVAAGVIGAGEAWLTELSNSEIRHVLKLRAEIQGE
jgi:SNF2 family DNA or RNA helicase